MGRASRCYLRWRGAGGVAFEQCPQHEVVAVARLEFDAGKRDTVAARKGIDPRRDVLGQGSGSAVADRGGIQICQTELLGRGEESVAQRGQRIGMSW